MVQEYLTDSLRDTNDAAVREIVDFLLVAPGKRLRPALVLLSAQAAKGGGNGTSRLPRASAHVAAAVELIHMASLVHDDLVDAAAVRHHRPSVQAKWDASVAVAVGDYLCARAFQLVACCADPRLFGVLGPHLCAMCEGELMQVIDRHNFHLSERRCLAMAEKKTAALFGACCGAGALTVGGKPGICLALQEFGLHFGIAFQLLDDCRDLLSDQEGLGKTPGQDLLAGDVTLPLLYLIRYGWGRAAEPQPRQGNPVGARGLAHLSNSFRASPAPAQVAAVITAHLDQARQALRALADSDFKNDLRQLADHLAVTAADILAR